ncbi:DUF6456 domain-containing protein [Profundibacterium mesophilum]|uniref:DUF6456 domain-containing protein n=1 Tax=Profundibacterium mesophilum KAUST100406-0324 TaxID=1037889 RepID=A0A921NY15_9RHOB|nr:DUF6456 domain-containing protein [Profundibacterium mesophilum]KAF0677470.1 hypothetical protein PMES_00163 [Profundibacterium mesophilum KAUST100406-0324]
MAMKLAHATLPDWVPASAHTYLQHVVDGVPIRELARRSGCHASTVLRQVRRCEQRRDDPLVDHALRRLGEQGAGLLRPGEDVGAPKMELVAHEPRTATVPHGGPAQKLIEREGRRILRRLSEPGACLAVAAGMEKAVVARETADGQTVRTAVVDREIAEAMALKDWIGSDGGGRIARYRITSAGRAALRRLIAEQRGEEEDAGGLRLQSGQGGTQRYDLGENPLLTLARRRDKSGKPFLSAELVAAGERLREDFELARMSPRGAKAFEAALSPGIRIMPADRGAGTVPGPEAALGRVEAALSELGPGLGDVALRCCCHLEGMEAIERRMGWAARSGKIVLRIALQRLRSHYELAEGPLRPRIG